MVKIEQTNNFTETILALPFISSIDTYYPDISNWYVNTVIPGIVTGKDILLLAKDNNKIVGIALAKNNDETKLRCIRVHQEYANKGIGVKLIDTALSIIGDKPLVSVSEELIHSYSRIFVNRYGFKLTEVLKGKYRQNKLEYYFNQ